MGDIISDIGNAISSVVNEVEQFDPIGQAVNAVGGLLNSLGVPKELTDGLEIAAGAMTGDLGLCAQGIAGETSDLCKDLRSAPATTEQTSAAAVAPQGYVDIATSNVQVAADSTVTDVDVNVQNSGGNASVNVDTSASNQASTVSGAGDSGGSMQAMDLNSPDVMNFVPNDPAEAQFWSMIRSGYNIGDPQCTPDERENFIHALKYKLQNDSTFRSDFEQQFGVKVCSNLPAGADQIIVSKAAASSQGNAQQPSTSASPGTAPWKPDLYPNLSVAVAVGGDPGIGGIMNDPSMSIEDKVMMILERCMDNTDGQISQTMDQLDAASRKGTSGNQPSNTDVQKLQLKLQQLMQQRQQMFDSASNLSKTFHDMSMAAINNMKG